MSCPKIFTISPLFTPLLSNWKGKEEKKVKVHIESPTMNQCFAQGYKQMLNVLQK
jgi:hypothetical protein